MSYSAQPENTNYPDDVELKSEIDRISARVDHIMETVKSHFPLRSCETKKNDAGEDAME